MVMTGDLGEVGKSETSGIDNVPLHTFGSIGFSFLSPSSESLLLSLLSQNCCFRSPQEQSLFDIMSSAESAAVDAAHSASLASRRLATLNNDDRNKALTLLHDALEMNRKEILEANARDVELATIAAESGNLSHSVLKRLDLSRPGKYKDMLDGILSVRDLDDPSEYTF